MPDGSHALSFGYFNVNTEETLEIPPGPDNFIEPALHDGVQPTHFLPVPEGDRRHWGVFTVRVPADFGDGEVIWTLRHDGRAYSVPGRIRSPHYQINGWIFPGRESSSPVLRLERDGPGAQGPAGISSGPVGAAAGEPLRLVAWTHRDGAFPDDARPILLRWFKHRGPGHVTFGTPEAEVPPEAWNAEGGRGGVHGRDLQRAGQLRRARTCVQPHPGVRIPVLLDQRVPACGGGPMSRDPRSDPAPAQPHQRLERA